MLFFPSFFCYSNSCQNSKCMLAFECQNRPHKKMKEINGNHNANKTEAEIYLKFLKWHIEKKSCLTAKPTIGWKRTKKYIIFLIQLLPLWLPSIRKMWMIDEVSVIQLIGWFESNYRFVKFDVYRTLLLLAK